MIDNVNQSTRSAIKALSYFHRSLVQAKLPQSIQSYRTMCDTLVGQRIWMLDKATPEVEANFDELAQVAESITQILQPYVENLQKLVPAANTKSAVGDELLSEKAESYEKNNTISDKKVSSDLGSEVITDEIQESALSNSIEGSAAKFKTDKGTSDAQQVVSLLKKYRKRTSITKIRAETGIKRKHLETVMQELLADGIIINHKVSGREMYTLAMETR